MKDIIQIILELKKLIEGEYLEIIYDVRNPLVIFEEFIKQVKAVTVDMEVKKIIGKNVKKIFDNIEKAYIDLIDYTFKFIENDFKYYTGIGLNFKNFNQSLETEYALATHLRKRSKIKQQINGKTQWIKSQIKLLEKTFRDFSRSGVLDIKKSRTLLQIITYFEDQFTDLTEFCTKRVDVANHMIVEAIVLQKEKHNDLEQLKKEMKQFYSNFISEQEELQQKTKSMWLSRQARKRIEEFKEYKKEIDKNLSKFEKEFTVKIDKVEKKDMESLGKERRELEKTVRSISEFGNKFKKTVAKATIALTVFTVLNGFVATTQTIPITFRKTPNKIQQVLTERKTSIEGCAAWVINQYVKMTHFNKDMVTTILGVVGNAWNMFSNIKARGGKVIFNAFNHVDKQKYESLRNEILQKTYDEKGNNIDHSQLVTILKGMNHLYRGKVLQLYPKIKFNKFSQLKVGDIVGICYPPSHNHLIALINNSSGTFNTHVGMVTSVEGGKIIISHNIYGKVYHTDINQLMVVWVIRPNVLFNLGKDIISTETLQVYNQSKIKITDDKVETSENIRFVLAMNEYKSMIREYYGLSAKEINNVVKISFGIYGVESKFGKANSYFAESIVDHFFKNIGIDLPISRSPIRYKAALSKKEIKDLNIDKDDIYNIKNAAKIVMAYIAKAYSIGKNVGFSGNSLIEAVIRSYIRGLGILYNRKEALSDVKGKSKYGKRFNTEAYLREVLGFMDKIIT